MYPLHFIYGSIQHHLWPFKIHLVAVSKTTASLYLALKVINLWCCETPNSLINVILEMCFFCGTNRGRKRKSPEPQMGSKRITIICLTFHQDTSHILPCQHPTLWLTFQGFSSYQFQFAVLRVQHPEDSIFFQIWENFSEVIQNVNSCFVISTSRFCLKLAAHCWEHCLSSLTLITIFLILTH